MDFTNVGVILTTDKKDHCKIHRRIVMGATNLGFHHHNSGIHSSLNETKNCDGSRPPSPQLHDITPAITQREKSYMQKLAFSFSL